ncbi:nucleoside-diphosphate sugar epimerase/dehydratase [uncultured Eubacterium sp.]|uniref:nucleoside-diphosphate sugar epimerase/dehydratase n=1 Tax=uncultured Eubacterium sp. TaxID=165185 RepID=UPI0025FBDDCC|nr:nucleoside-diphosphate sugar epimerase/dehydratase [uncultured Eubacterium sp.]
MSENSYKMKRMNAFSRKAVIAILDAVLLILSNGLTCYFTMDGRIADTGYSDIVFSVWHIGIIAVLGVAINSIFGLYNSVWSYAGFDEIIRSVFSATVIDAVLLFVDRVMFVRAFGIQGRLRLYSYVIMWLLFACCIAGTRIAYRIIRSLLSRIAARSSKNERVLIVGAGFMGDFVIEMLRHDDYKNGRPIVAVDDNPVKLHKKIEGIKIVGNCDDIPKVAEKYRIDTIILCLPSASKKRQKEILSIAMQTKCTVKTSPSQEEMFDAGNPKRIRNVDITDLLSRPEITLDKKACSYLVDATVLVTGGGGSIGSEICSQVARYKPKKIIIFDIYENCAFELANHLIEKYGDTIDIYVRIGSVRDIDRLHEIMEEFHPDVVFHAAAHKHVPLMEDSPCEAVKNNVFATYNVAVAADEYKVNKMVILSTDKAVNPTNVMGCTKRITEIIVQYMNKKSQNTKYAAVRFGNVLGSHGSVVPIFKEQIANGGPVRVTHPDITRYFMTIPEAAQLVCQAGGLAEGGEVFVLDMGEPVKIMDLAKNLIRLSGFDENEIPIEITGLRPGEKLYEELSMSEELETRSRTANEKIFVNQPMKFEQEEFVAWLESLKDINENNVREKLMAIVPNYHPANN